MVNVLQGATATILHTNPQFVPPQITAIICNYIRMSTIFHHKNFLLNNSEVIPLKHNQITRQFQFSCRQSPKWLALILIIEHNLFGFIYLPGSSLMTLIAAKSLVDNLLAFNWNKYAICKWKNSYLKNLFKDFLPYTHRHTFHSQFA